MDAAGDQDLKLRKSSPELIAELRRSLPQFLWKSKKAENGSDSKITGRVRRLVRKAKTDQLIKLLEPFQEWPQLLDPHLSDLLQPLVSAFIEYLCNHKYIYNRITERGSSQDIIPLPRAICKILYIFCKVRGQKVIIRFLNNEPKYLEPVLDALESWAQTEPSASDSTFSECEPMVWEEKFVMLWWLSHLILAPFDLVSMASESLGQHIGSPALDIQLACDTPPIAKRLLHVSTSCLGCPSKEREAAGMLLARVALKPDMQSLGLHQVILDSTMSLLSQWLDASMQIYTLLGVLSFLARFVVSADSHALQPFLEPIYDCVEYLKSEQSPFFYQVTSSTLARKLVIKISRAVAVARLKTELWENHVYPDPTENRLENTIDFLFQALEDKDTSVRIAASKALSMTTVHLEDYQANSVCSDALTELVLDVRSWTDPHNSQVISRSDFEEQGIQTHQSLPSSFKPDFGDVDAKKWHGYVLTLSQLIFHGAANRPILQMILDDVLATSLHFEQRSSLGVPVGANVRDAACFGLWAVARRCSTSEINDLGWEQPQLEPGSRIQSLANDLIVAATLDPAGNIRRGASAALQEMVGRHPDEIKHGIELVQVVDYHAVALRSGAILDVATRASTIDEMYWQVILDGLLSWRGVGSTDAQSRRHAAEAIGRLTLNSKEKIKKIVTLKTVRDQLRRTSFEKVELRHGLILALAQIVLAMLQLFSEATTLSVRGSPLEDLDFYYLPNGEMAALWRAFYFDDSALSINNVDAASFGMQAVSLSLRTDLIHEAVCRLISALAFSVISDTMNLRDYGTMPPPSAADLQVCIETVNWGLRKIDPLVISAASEAAANLFRIIDHPKREQMIHKWLANIDIEHPGRRLDHLGLTAALGAVFQHVGPREVESTRTEEMERARIAGHEGVMQWLDFEHEGSQRTSPTQMLVIDTLLEQLSLEYSIEQRCASLASLTSGVIKCQVVTGRILDAVYASLGDYTINEKGDVGSLLRIEAINAVTMLLGKNLLDENDTKQKILARTGGLAAEKLDKVRWQAWNCLQPFMLTIGFDQRLLAQISDLAQTSSSAYFGLLLDLGSQEWIRKSLLEGYIVSAGVGSESLVQATRAAFTTSLESWTHEVGTIIMNVFKENLTNDRLLLPTMEFMAFLFDANILRPLASEEQLWWSFFGQLQKTHYKSSNIPKIVAAIKIYVALVKFVPLKKVALKKLCQLLLHPYPRVRNATADSLFIVTQDEEIMAVNWGKSPKELSSHVDGLRSRLGIEK